MQTKLGDELTQSTSEARREPAPAPSIALKGSVLCRNFPPAPDCRHPSKILIALDLLAAI